MKRSATSIVILPELTGEVWTIATHRRVKALYPGSTIVTTHGPVTADWELGRITVRLVGDQVKSVTQEVWEIRSAGIVAPRLGSYGMTKLELVNASGQPVLAYITLGATPGCVQDVALLTLSGGLTVTPLHPLMGTIALPAGETPSHRHGPRGSGPQRQLLVQHAAAQLPVPGLPRGRQPGGVHHQQRLPAGRSGDR